MNDVISFRMQKGQGENRKIFHYPTIDQGINNFRYSLANKNENKNELRTKLEQKTKSIYDESNSKIPVGTSLNKFNVHNTFVGQNDKPGNRYENSLVISGMYQKPKQEDTGDAVYYSDYNEDGIY